MHIKDYQLAAQRTCPDLGFKKDFYHMQMGIATEIGEIIDIMKKKLAYGKDVDTVHLGEEIGDAFWYIVNKFRMKGITLEQPLSVHSEVEALTPEAVYDILNEYLMLEYGDNMLILKLDIIAQSFGLDTGKLLETNIAKLKARYPDKFDAEKALNRDLDTERKVLEDGNSIEKPADQ